MVLFRAYYYVFALSPIPRQSGVLTWKIIVTVFHRKIHFCFDLKDDLERLMEPEEKCQM